MQAIYSVNTSTISRLMLVMIFSVWSTHRMFLFTSILYLSMLAQVSECLLEIEWSLCLADHITWFSESTLEHLKTRPDKWNKLKIKPQDFMPIPSAAIDL